MAQRVAHRPPFWRHLIDIVLFVAFTLGLGFALQASGFRPPDGALGYAAATGIQLLSVLAAWALIRARGERLSAIGLRAPQNWPLCLGIAIGFAAALYAISLGLEASGVRRDLSSFAALHSNLALTMAAIGYALVGAGFGEEFVFRGFLMRSLAGGLGDGRVAWIAAAVVQAVLFGFAHGAQGLTGMLFTGGAALVAALLFFAAGRNLWPLILGHGLYDAARFATFYLYGAPSG
ncbi:MAG: CPBP family intramembrane glutamic endopeptidase [Hyphomonadaceae bacterium]